MKRCGYPILKGGPVRTCLRRAVERNRCAKHARNPLPLGEVIRQCLDPLGDYVEAEIERTRRLEKIRKNHYCP